MQNQSTDRPRLSAANIKVRKPSASDDKLITRLQTLDRSLLACNKHDRAFALISACISSGIRAQTAIASTLVELGFNRGHVWLMIKEGRGYHWREDSDGNLELLT